MTKDEQVVLDVLEHSAKQWDATDPVQAQSFRDAAKVLTDAANRSAPPVAAPPFPPATPPSAEPVRSNDPADAPMISTPTNPDLETPVNG